MPRPSLCAAVAAVARLAGRGLICKDISGGVEEVPIPCFNEIDNTHPPALEYVRCGALDPPRIARAAPAKNARRHGCMPWH